MGWVREGPGPDEQHEGYAAFVTRDGRSSSGSSSHGALFDRPDREQAVAAAWAAGRTPRNEDMYDLVPWEELLGWQATCSCGWTGSTWERTASLPGEYGGHDADDAYLPDGDTVSDAVYEQWQQHVEPLSRLGAVRAAARAAVEARRALDAAVAAARASEPAVSWAEIGSATGMSRQAAHERWGGTARAPQQSADQSAEQSAAWSTRGSS